ncbi:hypothetical protein [uncultured Sphingomonas sp.]|uniref:hypothetical protein n=1 Tax=uncultured Sphingomonas sp. TaxID=158754 RepID=UPI0035C9E449
MSEMSRPEAETFLRELATRADDIVGTHIRGITFGHDDLRKLSGAVHVLLGDAVTTGN